jgi:ferredoxin
MPAWMTIVLPQAHLKVRASLVPASFRSPCPASAYQDTACVDACPVDCIHPKKDESEFEDAPQLYIDPQERIDCGACVPVCPVSAILLLDDLPTLRNRLHSINKKQRTHNRLEAVMHATQSESCRLPQHATESGKVQESKQFRLKHPTSCVLTVFRTSPQTAW